MPRRLQNKSYTIILLFGTNATTIDSAAFNLSGFIKNIYVTVPALDSGTATLNIKDAAGNVVYTKAALAASATTSCALAADVAVAGNIIFEIVTSASQTANRTFVIAPIIDSLI